MLVIIKLFEYNVKLMLTFDDIAYIMEDMIVY